LRLKYKNNKYIETKKDINIEELEINMDSLLELF
jgi:hypothetical protein